MSDVVITEPGVYPDLSAADYHAQLDWLSASGSKKLLKPSCPAKFKAWLGVEEEHKKHFDLGAAVHSIVLGKGEELVVVQAKDRKGQPYDAKDYATKAAQEHRDAIYAAGNVPLLRTQLTEAQAMAAAVMANPIAAALFSAGLAEVSIFWVDEATGVKCRARLDWLPEPRPGRRMVVPDLKTAISSDPDEFSRAAARLHYAMQDAHYSEAVIAAGIDPDPAFLFVVVEKEDPYLVTPGQLSAGDKQLGRDLCNKARRIYRQCLETDTWPAYTDGIADLVLPTWHLYEYEEYAAS